MAMFYANTHGGSRHVLILETEKEKQEFQQLIRRATNTWDTMPQWVRTIADGLEDNPTPQ